jgi:uncharacterized protein (TIGR02147 family)
MAELSIYSFDDHKKFLMSVFVSRKKDQPRLSLGTFSKLIGFGSGNYARMIFDGKRNLTIEHVHGVACALSLSFEETEYFEALVFLRQACSEPEKRYYRRRLNELRRDKPNSTAKFTSRVLPGDWHFPFVLLAADRAPFGSAIDRIVGLLPIDSETAKTMPQKMIDSALLIKGKEFFQLNHSHQIFHDVKSTGNRHKEFLRKQLDLSRRVLERRYEKGARFYSHSFTIARSDFGYYEDRLRSMLSEFTARSDKSSPDEIVQLNMQLFGVCRDCF